MKRTISACILVVGIAVATGCSRGHRAEHATRREEAEPPPPTPDTTPIPALRTPAGLVLGVESTPAPVSPSPAATPAAAPTTPVP